MYDELRQGTPPSRAPFNWLWVPDHYWTRALVVVPGVSRFGPRVFRFGLWVSRFGTLILSSRVSRFGPQVSRYFAICNMYTLVKKR